MRFILTDDTIRYSKESPNTKEVGFYFLTGGEYQLEFKKQLIADTRRIDTLFHCEKTITQK